MPDLNHLIPLSLLPRAIAEFTGGPAPTYLMAYHGAVAGRFPAQWRKGRWRIRLEDLPLAADALGVAHQRRRRRVRPRSAEAPSNP
jgi:hypothetical protein